MADSRGPDGAGGDDLRFRVLELRRDPTGHISEVRKVQVAPTEVGDCAPDGSPVEVSATLETVSDGVRVTGSVDFGWVGSCRRCLETARGDASSEFEELFVDDPERWVATDDAGAEEVHPIEQGWIDLTEVVRDSVLLGLPLAPLCRADCAGPDPGSFPVTVEREPAGDAPARVAEGGEEPPMDPRWAKLSEVTFEPDTE
jgi:uncharacterized protein